MIFEPESHTHTSHKQIHTHTRTHAHTHTHTHTHNSHIPFVSHGALFFLLLRELPLAADPMVESFAFLIEDPPTLGIAGVAKMSQSYEHALCSMGH